MACIGEGQTSEDQSVSAPSIAHSEASPEEDSYASPNTAPFNSSNQLMEIPFDELTCAGDLYLVLILRISELCPFNDISTVFRISGIMEGYDKLQYCVQLNPTEQQLQISINLPLQS